MPATIASLLEKANQLAAPFEGTENPIPKDIREKIMSIISMICEPANSCIRN